MGIPGLFGWLVRKYKMIYYKNLLTTQDILYIDGNCLFHPVCAKFAHKNTDELINEIILHIEKIINIINPKKYTLIAVDGVPPNAKICQQKKRRYKSAYDDEQKNLIKIKYNKEIYNWNGINITPGTKFMEKLDREINKYIKNKKIKYSSYRDPGEGEHKIMDDIKTKTKENIVIYGLDADLIMLSMIISNIGNVYLMRDNVLQDDIKYLHINKILCYISEEINQYIYIDNLSSNRNYYIKDLILIGFLLGNDFLPRLPTVNIRKNGYEIILDNYIEYYNSILSLLVTNNKINQANLKQYLQLVSNKEFEYYSNNNEYPKKHNNDPYENELEEYDRNVDKDVDNYINNSRTIEELKFKYYGYFFKSYEHQNETIEDICRNYIDGLKWIYEYYINGCKNWSWYYPYNRSPFASDLYKFLEKYPNYLDNVIFKEDNPISINSQLLNIIPPLHKNILPLDIQKLMLDSKNINQFPQNFILDTYDNVNKWQCNPVLPLFYIVNAET